MREEAAQKLVQDVLLSSYQQNAFRLLVRNLLRESLTEEDLVLPELDDKYREHIGEVRRLGTFEGAGDEEMDVLAIRLDGPDQLDRARTRQRNLVADYLKGRGRDAALVAFWSDGTGSWRLSFVQVDFRAVLNDKGEVATQEELTPPRRYSFIVGEGEPCHTAQKQLLGLLTRELAPTVENLEKAFSIEAVTEDFYRVYQRLFEQVESAVTGLGSGKGGAEKRRLFTQRLFNRLLFVRFLEKKGWLTLNGREDYLCALWEDYQETGGSSFYDERLKLLFFSALNNSAQVQMQEIPGIGRVPYLNGGLFDEEVEDANVSVTVPDAVLAPLMDELFYTFNFTVSESTPLDQEVAVDPEMLGRVFERLVTGRGDSGSYYTPRPVVAFMCKEALKDYLGHQYADLIEHPTSDEAAESVSVAEAKQLLKRLDQLKVLDPACGSGAYLLGMLQELHQLYSALDTRAQDTARSDYERKLRIIQRTLYGVDLDSFATNIAQLRLWLSLAVEHGGAKPEPLPNLTFSIGTGNSLTGPDPSQMGSFFRQQAEGVAAKLVALKSEYQTASGSTKRQRLKEIHAEEDKLRKALGGLASVSSDAFDWRIGFVEVFVPPPAQATISGEANLGHELADVRPGGFDIVLANPPYGAKTSTAIRDRYFKSSLDGAQSKDTYGLFMARGLELLKPGGTLCYIVSDTWRTIKSHRPLRNRLVKRTSVRHVLDLPTWIFDAVVNTGIVTLTKRKPDESQQIVAGDLRGIAKGDWPTLEKNLRAVAESGPDVQTLEYARYTYPQKLIERYDNQSFFIGSPRLYGLLFDKSLRRLGSFAEVRQGLATADNKYYIRAASTARGGYDDVDPALVLTDAEVAGLSASEKQDGVDPQKYGGRHVIPFDKGGASDSGEGWLPNYHVPTEYFIDWSEASVHRLHTATRADVKRGQGRTNGITAADEATRAAVIRNPQFYFRDGLTFSPTGEYSPSFRVGSASVFGNKGSTIFFDGAGSKAMLGLLASRAARYLLKVYLSHTVETGEEVLTRLPVPDMTDEQAAKMKQLVQQIIAKQKADLRYPYHAHEQQEIDRIVYELFDLTDEDIREIELWYCRRYPRLAEAQGLTAHVEQAHADVLDWARTIMSKPPRYWRSHPVLRTISEGESQTLEFKETLHAASDTGDKHEGVLHGALKTIAAFLNTAGGTLLIGVSDDGEIRGLAKDYALCQDNNQNADGLENKLISLLQGRMTPPPAVGCKLGKVCIRFHTLPAGEVCEVIVKPDLTGVVLKDKQKGKDVFYTRQGNTTRSVPDTDVAAWQEMRK
jgi:hypothetical protein